MEISNYSFTSPVVCARLEAVLASRSGNFTSNSNPVEPTTNFSPSVEQWQGYLMFVGLAGCAFLVAKTSNWVVTHVYRDQYGISGAFWYASGATIQILLFSILSVQLKIKAPGAKTFLQVIRARFGRTTHITYCVFALLTNMVVTAMLMLGGAAVLTSLVKGFSIELATILVAATISAYTFVGGLSATIYVSYFNTAIMMIIMLIFLVKVYYDPSSGGTLGSIPVVFDAITCLEGPHGNKDFSYLTIVSFNGLMFGIINIVGNFGAVFVDQSYWQASVAGKPLQAVLGFLMGGMAWFAVPFTFASTMGLAYLALGTNPNTTVYEPLLTADQVSQGLVAPLVAEKLLGWSGEIMCVLMIVMAVTSTGAAEVVAVTSILVYDIYQLYLKPFRLVFDVNTCILCGCERGRKAQGRKRNVCHCISMTYCTECGEDNKIRSRENWRRPVKPAFVCHVHGSFRTYNEFLHRLKNWCQILTTIAILPLTIVLESLNVSLGWVYLFMGVVIGSAVVPIVLLLYWTRLTGPAMTAGVIGGTLLGLIAWLAVAATLPGGLGAFLKNTGDETSMLAGNLVSILSGALITIVVTLVTNRREIPSSEKLEIWETTRDIDNPLRPWTELYARDLGWIQKSKLDDRPSLKDMEDKYGVTKMAACIASIALTFCLVFVWPLATIADGVMDLTHFTQWIYLVTAFGFIATIFIIVWPAISEFIQIRHSLREKNLVDAEVSNITNSAHPHSQSPHPRHPDHHQDDDGNQSKMSTMTVTSTCHANVAGMTSVCQEDS